MSHVCTSHTCIHYIKMSWYVSHGHQVVSVIYYKCDSALLCYSTIIRLTGRGHHYDWLQRERGKNNMSRLWNTIPQAVKVKTPNTSKQRHFNHHVPISYLLSCIADNINRDGQQLPPRGIMSSSRPRACWEHRDNRLWQYEKWRAMNVTSKQEAGIIQASITMKEPVFLYTLYSNCFG